MKQIKVDELGWLYEEQVAERDFGTPWKEADLIESLSTGWNVSEGILDAFTYNDSYKQQIIAGRKWLCDQIISVHGDKDVKVSETLTLSVKGFTEYITKLPLPKYIAVNGHRRSVATMVIDYNKSQGAKTPLIPINIDEGLIKAESRLIARIRENSRVGRKPYSSNNHLVLAINLVKLGHGVSSLTRLLNVKYGSSQRLHTFAILHNRYPELNLLTRALKEFDRNKTVYEAGTCAIPWTSVPTAHYYLLCGNAKEFNSANQAAAQAIKLSELNKIATAEQIEDYIKKVMYGKEVSKPLTIGQLETLLKQRNNVPSEKLLKAHLCGDIETFVSLLDKFDAVKA